ncbi:thioredoxin family protein [Bacteroidales bacterium]
MLKNMEIKILGTSCAKCKTTQAVVEKVVAESGVKATITKIEDIVEIMKYNVMFTPAIVVDEIVKIKGRIPSEKEVKQILGL